MKAYRNRAALFAAFFATAVVALAASLRAAENPADSGELRYRRVYVPEGMTDWPRGSVKYLPMDAEEFERLIVATQRTARGAAGQAAVGLAEAQYEARLKGPALLQGSGTLDVSQSIAGAMLMNLDPCNLAISEAQWITSDGAPAALGLSGDGKLQVLAERAGRMKVDWSLAGQRDANGGASFSIALPPSPVNQLRIELPADLTPLLDHGVISDEGPTEPGFHRYRLELGGRSVCRLRLAKPGHEEARPQTLLAGQSTIYSFSLRGLEVTVNLSIEAHRARLPNLALDLDPSLELVEVLSGDDLLTWNAVAGLSGKTRAATIALPPALQEGTASLRLRAIAPLSTGASWKLPRINVEGAVYKSNTMHLLVAAPLCIKHLELEPNKCRQTGATAMANSAGEQLDLEAFSPDAGIEVALAQNPTDVRAVSAAATTLGQGKMTSRVATDFRSGEGSVFALEAEVLPNWTIDSIESRPIDGLDDWTLQGGNGARKLSIRLARPLSSTRPLRLIVSARRLYAFPGRNLGIDDLVPLRYSGLAESMRWVDLHASGSNELRITAGSRLRRADVKDLTAAELDLFAELPGDMLFHDDAGAAGLRLSLENRRPTYSAAIRLEAVAGDGLLAENYTLACTPSKAAPIDRVVVHFTGRRDGPLNWSVAGMEDSRFSARRWTAQQESSAGLTADEDNWEVTFRSPRSEPIEIHASRKSSLTGPTPVCLASLPDAARQDASVIVRSLGPQIVELKTHRLKQLPTDAAPADRLQTARASYQYDPKNESTPQSEPALLLTPAANDSPAAWVWDCDIYSQFASRGSADHFLRYRIQNAGIRQIRLKLPAGLLRRDIHEVWVNDKPAAVRASEPTASECTVDLPADLKSVTLVLQISTYGEALGNVSRLQPPTVDVGLPVFARHWRLQLPPGYETCSFGDGQAGSAAEFSAFGCLLGGLGRSGDSTVFNPFHREDWRGLLNWSKTEDHLADSEAVAAVADMSRYSADSIVGAASVIVIRRATADGAGWLLFLVIVGIGAWGLSSRPIALLALALGLGLIAFALPAAISGIFSRGLLGILFCMTLGLVRRRKEAANTESQSRVDMPSTLTNVLPFAAPAFAAVMLLCGLGTTEAGETAAAAPATYSVFIPVDEKQQPTKGKYFLPETFFSELYRRAALHAEKPQGWMITSAVYRATLTDDMALARHVIDRLTAEFGIHVFNAAARVRIPIRRDEVSLEPGQTRLDDRAVQPDWEGDGSALLLEIAEPGDYRLELTLQPTRQPGNRSTNLDLAIPRVPSSRVEISLPTGGPQIDFPSALGGARWDEVLSHWTAELGPSNRLALSWQEESSADVPEGIDVEQLLWLKIRPGCALLDVRVKAKAAGGLLRRLVVRADSNLELLPTSGTGPAVQVHGSGEMGPTYELQWSQPVAATNFDLHFLYAGGSSLGTFRVPQIDVVNARLLRRSLAVSIDPAIDYAIPGSRVQENGAVPEFVSNWGSGDAPPDMAFRLNGNAADWSLTTRPRRAETSADQKVTWIFGAQSVETQFSAQLSTTGSVFQYRLEAPPALHVSSITVMAEGANRAARWSQEKDGGVTVFLAGPVSGRHEFQLHGQLPLPKNRKLALPPIRLENVRIQNSIVNICRRPDVLVEVSGVGDAAEIKAVADNRGQDDSGRPVRSFYVEPAAVAPVQAIVRANRPRARAEQTTRIAFDEKQWRTTCDFNVHVSEGLLDDVELEVPASWKDRVTTGLDVAGTFAARSDERATLVLSPSAAISGDFAFSLSGPPTSATRVAVANVGLQHVANVKRYVVLPKSADHRTIAWSLQNLRSVGPKENEKGTSGGDTVKYEVAADSWQAVLQPPQRTNAKTRVIRADLRYAWQGDGRCLGAAFFDVETAGRIDCSLQLPDGFNLLQVTVDGLPVDAVRGAADAWMVPLASLATASRVEILFFSESAPAHDSSGLTGRYSFAAPKLGDLPVEQYAWTIVSPPSLQPAVAADVESQTPPAPDPRAAPSGIAAQWQGFVTESHAIVSVVTSGTKDSIALDYRPVLIEYSWIPRLKGLAVFLVVIGLAAFLLRRGLLQHWFARWPYLFGIGIGLAWWLWLSPSAVGLVIVLAVAWRQIRSWRRLLHPTATRAGNT